MMIAICRVLCDIKLMGIKKELPQARKNTQRKPEEFSLRAGKWGWRVTLVTYLSRIAWMMLSI
jgi:hypothetical protein